MSKKICPLDEQPCEECHESGELSCPVSGDVDGFTGWICCRCGDLQSEYEDRDPKDPRCNKCKGGPQ